mmetsp:Transcript_25509/g.33332  ORF Transcript_25509/g.33332 Transcript_25509/m.33332 type:complete len:135 (+) Transcript_25509:223-627(+)
MNWLFQQEIVEAEPTRVFGVGVGVFLIAFFAALGVLICLIGVALGRRLIFFLIGSGIFLLVITILFGAEKSTQYVVVEETLQEYNTKFVVRTLYLCILFVGLVMSLIASIGYITEDIQAEVIEDIESKRKRHFL